MHLYIVRPYRLSVNIFLSVVGFFFGSLSILSLFAATLINFMHSYRKHESDEHYPLLYFFNQIWVMFFLFFFNHMSGREKNIKIFQLDSFLLVSKSVAIQVHNYLNCKNPFPALRSAYIKHLSTETALLRVTDDIPKTLDSNGEVVFVLLDLSAAFGTLDHQTLLKRLRKYFNFPFYFTEIEGRSRRVSLADGVPQNSILGPLHYCSLFIWHLSKMLYIALVSTPCFMRTRPKVTSSTTILKTVDSVAFYGHASMMFLRGALKICYSTTLEKLKYYISRRVSTSILQITKH